MKVPLHRVTLTYDDWGWIMTAISDYCENPTMRQRLTNDISRIRQYAMRHNERITGTFPMELAFTFLEKAGYTIDLSRSKLP